MPMSPDEAGEYAILLRSDLKGRGLGWSLMQLMIEYAKSDGSETDIGSNSPAEYRDAEKVPGTGIRDQD